MSESGSGWRPSIERVDPYLSIREWWGQDLDVQLRAKVAKAPVSQLNEFLTFHREFRVLSNLEALPDISSGTLRPLLKKSRPDYEGTARSPRSYLDRASSLALYCNELVVEDPTLALFSITDLSSVINWLSDIRPLYDAGFVHFLTYPRERLRHPSRTHGVARISAADPDAWRSEGPGRELALELDRLTRLHPDRNQLDDYIFSGRVDSGLSLNLAGMLPGKLNPLSTSSFESFYLRAAIMKAGLGDPGGNLTLMSRLASIELPSLNVAAIAAVRSDNLEFAEWRSALKRALLEVEGFRSDDQAWQESARAVIQDELFPVTTRLEKSVQRSHALSALSSGGRGFSMSALGAVVGGVAGGNVAAGLAGAGTAKALESAAEYVQAVRGRRRDRAVLDLALSFARDPQPRGDR